MTNYELIRSNYCKNFDKWETEEYRTVEVLEEIKEEIQGLIDFDESCSCNGDTSLGYECLGVINDKISELKGENQ